MAARALQHPMGTAQGAGRTGGTQTPHRDFHNGGRTLVTVTLNFSAFRFPKQPGCEHTERQDGILYSHEQTLARPACRSCSQLLDGANKGGFLHRLASKTPSTIRPRRQVQTVRLCLGKSEEGQGRLRSWQSGEQGSSLTACAAATKPSCNPSHHRTRQQSWILVCVQARQHPAVGKDRCHGVTSVTCRVMGPSQHTLPTDKHPPQTLQ